MGDAKMEAGNGSRGKVRCKGRRMRWVIDHGGGVRVGVVVDGNSFGGVGLGVAWWDWFQGLGLWDPVPGSDDRTCGGGLSWDSPRRCCLVPGMMTN